MLADGAQTWCSFCEGLRTGGPLCHRLERAGDGGWRPADRRGLSRWRRSRRRRVIGHVPSDVRPDSGLEPCSADFRLGPQAARRCPHHSAAAQPSVRRACSGRRPVATQCRPLGRGRSLQTSMRWPRLPEVLVASREGPGGGLEDMAAQRQHVSWRTRTQGQQPGMTGRKTFYRALGKTTACRRPATTARCCVYHALLTSRKPRSGRTLRQRQSKTMNIDKHSEDGWQRTHQGSRWHFGAGLDPRRAQAERRQVIDCECRLDKLLPNSAESFEAYFLWVFRWPTGTLRSLSMHVEEVCCTSTAVAPLQTARSFQLAPGRTLVRPSAL